MRHWIRKWLGLTSLEDRLVWVVKTEMERERILNSSRLLALEEGLPKLLGILSALEDWRTTPVSPIQPTPAPEPKEEKAPPSVENAISVMWGDNPMAAQMTRTYAKSLVSGGLKPDQVAKLVREHGTIIE